MRARAGRPMRMGLRIHIIARPLEREAREAARELLSRAEVAGDRAAEYARFDSVGQARMNAIPADDEGWVAPGLWAGIRAVRGGAGTALVGSYQDVARMLREYRDAGVDLVIASGYPHLEEVGRVGTEVWPRVDRRGGGRRAAPTRPGGGCPTSCGPPTRARRRAPRSWPSASEPPSTSSRARASRPRPGPSRRRRARTSPWPTRSRPTR